MKFAFYQGSLLTLLLVVLQAGVRAQEAPPAPETPEEWRKAKAGAPGDIGMQRVDLAYGNVNEFDEEKVGGKLGPGNTGVLSLSVPMATGQVTLSGPGGDKPVKLWTSAAKTQRVALPATWAAGAVPGTLYLEATDASAAMRDISFTLTYTGAGATLSDTVKLTVAKLKVEARLKGDGEYASSATIAAGAIDSNEHKADIRITAKLPDETPLAGVTVNAPHDISAGFNETTSNMALAPSSGTTDADGVLLMECKSSNRTEPGVLKFLYDQTADPAAEDSAGATLTLNQVWNSLAGSPAHMDPINWFIVNPANPVDENTPPLKNHIKYYMRFLGNRSTGKKITGHDVTFKTTMLAGAELDTTAGIDFDDDDEVDLTGIYVPRIYVADPEEESGIGPGGAYTALAAYTGTTAADGDYEADVTIKNAGSGTATTFYVSAIGIHAVDKTALNKAVAP